MNRARTLCGNPSCERPLCANEKTTLNFCCAFCEMGFFGHDWGKPHGPTCNKKAWLDRSAPRAPPEPTDPSTEDLRGYAKYSSESAGAVEESWQRKEWNSGPAKKKVRRGKGIWSDNDWWKSSGDNAAASEIPAVSSDSTPAAPRMSVEEFIAESGLDEKTADELRHCEPEVQSKVLAAGGIKGAWNPSATLRSRIRAARIANRGTARDEALGSQLPPPPPPPAAAAHSGASASAEVMARVVRQVAPGIIQDEHLLATFIHAAKVAWSSSQAEVSTLQGISDDERLEAFIKIWIADTLTQTFQSIDVFDTQVGPTEFADLFEQVCTDGGLPKVLVAKVASSPPLETQVVLKAVADAWDVLCPPDSGQTANEKQGDENIDDPLLAAVVGISDNTDWSESGTAAFAPANAETETMVEAFEASAPLPPEQDEKQCAAGRYCCGYGHEALWRDDESGLIYCEACWDDDSIEAAVGSGVRADEMGAPVGDWDRARCSSGAECLAEDAGKAADLCQIGGKPELYCKTCCELLLATWPHMQAVPAVMV